MRLTIEIIDVFLNGTIWLMEWDVYRVAEAWTMRLVLPMPACTIA